MRSSGATPLARRLGEPITTWLVQYEEASGKLKQVSIDLVTLLPDIAGWQALHLAGLFEDRMERVVTKLPDDSTSLSDQVQALHVLRGDRGLQASRINAIEILGILDNALAMLAKQTSPSRSTTLRSTSINLRPQMKMIMVRTLNTLSTRSRTEATTTARTQVTTTSTHLIFSTSSGTSSRFWPR